MNEVNEMLAAVNKMLEAVNTKMSAEARPQIQGAPLILISLTNQSGEVTRLIEESDDLTASLAITYLSGWLEAMIVLANLDN